MFSTNCIAVYNYRLPKQTERLVPPEPPPEPPEPPAPTSCPCTTWPPASWPCGGLNQTYNLSYNVKKWHRPKTSCDGEPDEVIHYNRTCTASPWSPCTWITEDDVWPAWTNIRLTDEGTWIVSLCSPPNGWEGYKGGNTPIGSYTDTECKGEGLTANIMFTDIVVL